MTEGTEPDDSLAGGWGRGIESETDTDSKDERLQPRSRALKTGWTVESFIDKRAVEENQSWRKVNNQHLLEAHYVSVPWQIPIITLHRRDYYLAQGHAKKLEFGIRFLRTPKPALFLLHSSFCAPLLHRAAQAPQATAEEASSLGVEVECISSTASVVTPPPRASLPQAISIWVVWKRRVETSLKWRQLRHHVGNRIR